MIQPRRAATIKIRLAEGLFCASRSSGVLREHHRDPDPVVRTECGAGRGQIISINLWHDGIDRKIKIDITVLLLDHIKM